MDGPAPRSSTCLKSGGAKTPDPFFRSCESHERPRVLQTGPPGWPPPPPCGRNRPSPQTPRGRRLGAGLGDRVVLFFSGAARPADGVPPIVAKLREFLDIEEVGIRELKLHREPRPTGGPGRCSPIHDAMSNTAAASSKGRPGGRGAGNCSADSAGAVDDGTIGSPTYDPARMKLTYQPEAPARVRGDPPRRRVGLERFADGWHTPEMRERSDGDLLPKTWSSLNGNRTTGREPGGDPCENDPDRTRSRPSSATSKPTSTPLEHPPGLPQGRHRTPPPHYRWKARQEDPASNQQLRVSETRGRGPDRLKLLVAELAARPPHAPGGPKKKP